MRSTDEWSPIRRNQLPEPLPPDEILAIDPGCPRHRERLIKVAAQMRQPCHIPHKAGPARVHLATWAGIRRLITIEGHEMTVEALCVYLLRVLPQKWGYDRPVVIRLALYAIRRELRKELKLAHLDERRALVQLVRHPIPIN